MSRLPQTRIRNEATLVFLSSAAFFLSYFGRMVWSVVGIYSSLHPSVAETGLVFSLFFVGYIVVQVPAGVISDRVRPNLVAGLAQLVLAVSLLLGGLAPTIEVEYVSSVIMGFSAGWIFPCTLKIMTALFEDRKKRLVMMGYYSLAWPLSIIFLGILLPPVALNLGWEWAYYVLAIISFLLGVLFLSSEVRGFKPQRMSFSFLVSKNSIIIALAGFLFYFAYWPVTLFAYDYFVSIGLGSYLSGVAVSSLAIAGIPSTLISGYVMNRLGIKKTVLISLLVYAALLFAMARTSVFALIIAIALVMGFFRFFITPANADIISVVGESRAGALSGFANLIWQASGTIAPIYAASVIGTFGYGANWMVMSFVVLAACVFYALISIPKAKPVKRDSAVIP